MISLIPIKKTLQKIWNDPVWSKVIAAGIIFLIGSLIARVTNHSWREIYSFILDALSFRMPIYLFFFFIASYFIVRLIRNIIRNKRDPFWDEKMGNYTFKDLYNTLILDKWPVPTHGMSMWGRKAPDDNIMELFRIYYPILTKGVDFYDNINDGHYLYGSLAPRLVGFGLVEAYEKPDDHLPGKTNVAYKISEMGHKFHAKLDKIGLKNKIKDAKTRVRK